MQRVTTTERDRAVRRLSAITGGITACSIGLTGAFMVLAKNETDQQRAAKAQSAPAPAQFALAAGTAPAVVSTALPTGPVGDAAEDADSIKKGATTPTTTRPKITASSTTRATTTTKKKTTTTSKTTTTKAPPPSTEQPPPSTSQPPPVTSAPS